MTLLAFASQSSEPRASPEAAFPSYSSPEPSSPLCQGTMSNPRWSQSSFSWSIWGEEKTTADIHVPLSALTHLATAGKAVFLTGSKVSSVPSHKDGN